MSPGEERIAIGLSCIIGGKVVTIPYHEAAHWGVTLTQWAARQKELRAEADEEIRGEEKAA